MPLIVKGLCTNYAIFCMFFIAMLYHFVHSGSIQSVKFSDSIFKFPHQLIRGSMKGLSPNLAIFVNYSIEMHHFVMRYGGKALENFYKSSLKFPYLLCIGIILE